MKKIILIIIISVFLLAGCARAQILNQTTAITTINKTEPSPAEIDIAIALPSDMDPNNLYFKLASDFDTVLLSTPQSWTMMPLDGGIINDDFILQTAYTAYEIYKESEDEIIKDENGLYLPVEIMQKTADLLFADPPEIDTYTFGNLYRNNEEYTDCIFIPFEFYKKENYYGNKYNLLYNTFRYNAETNNITCAISFNKPDVDGKFMGLDCRKEFLLSPLIYTVKHITGLTNCWMMEFITYNPISSPTQ
jgi:hypothetical protein